MCADILDLIYTFSIVSCSIYQMVLLARKRLNADVSCCLKDANRIYLICSEENGGHVGKISVPFPSLYHPTHYCCVSIQGLHPSEEHLKDNYVSMWRKGCPSPEAPPNAAHKFSSSSLFLEDAPLLSFVASHIPRFFARSKKKKERENGDIAWGSSSISWAWASEIVT